MGKLELNPKQKAFCDDYLKSGNATQSYKDVYKVSDKVAGAAAPRLLENVRVKEHLKERQSKVDRKRIASIEDVQAFWAETMADQDANRSDRLKASELIAKSNAMFTENLNVGAKEDAKVTFEIVRKRNAKDSKNT